MAGAGAPGDLAAHASRFEGGALVGGGSPPEVGDVADVDPVGDHQRQEGVAEEVAGDGDGDGADAGDLAGLACHGVDRAAWR